MERKDLLEQASDFIYNKLKEKYGPEDTFYPVYVQTLAKDDLEKQLKIQMDRLEYINFYRKAQFQLIMNDRLFLDQNGLKLSLTKIEGFQSWSEMIQRLYPGYRYNKQLLQLEQIEERSIEYKQFREMMISKVSDESWQPKIQEFEDTLAKENKIFLSSKLTSRGNFPFNVLVGQGRSGTHSLISQIEQITGLSAGNCIPHYLLAKYPMIAAGFRGENIHDQRIWVVKYPCHVFYTPLKFNRMVLAVRDPLDVFQSLFQYVITLTPNKNMQNEITKDYAEEYNFLFESSIKRWEGLYSFWMEEYKKKTVPVYFRKFEVCMNDPASLKELFAFYFGLKTIEGTYIEKRIDASLKDENLGKIYQRRSKEKLKALLTEEHLNRVKEVCGDALFFFGYAKVNESDPEGRYVFKEPTQRQLELHQQYKKANAETMNWSAEDHERIEAEPYFFRDDCLPKHMNDIVDLEDYIIQAQKKVVIEH